MLILIIIIIFILTINNRQIRDRCTLHSILFAKRYKFSENNFYVNLSYNVIIIFISHFIYAPNLEHISNCLKNESLLHSLCISFSVVFKLLIPFILHVSCTLCWFAYVNVFQIF